MKFKLNINKPCGENWQLMPKTEQGRFCKSCNKNLIDFSDLSNTQIYNIVNSGKSICGKFSNKQLNSKFETNKHNSVSKIRLIASFTSLISFVNPVYAQPNTNAITEISTNYTKNKKQTIKQTDTNVVKIEGKVVLDGEKLPFANVLIKNTSIGTQTDLEGKFSLTIAKSMFESEVVLMVNFVGYNTETIKINKNSNNLIINLNSYEQITIGIVCVVKKPTFTQRFFDLFRRKSKKKFTYWHDQN